MKTARNWGNWKLFKAGHLELKTNKSRCIDLRRCHDSAEILDWIFHFQSRLETQDLADMITALEEILDPRANYCSQGSSKTHNPMELVRAYWARTARDA